MIYLLRKSKTLRIVILVAGNLAIALLFLLPGLIDKDETEKQQQEKRMTKSWNMLKAGDSVFVKDGVTITVFYKKGRKKLNETEQKDCYYQRNDTVEFFKINELHEKYYYQNKTSFIGICLGKDSTQTVKGFDNKYRWVKIKPIPKITRLKDINEFEYSQEKWKYNTGLSSIDPTLGNDFYLKFTAVSLLNSDSTYRNQTTGKVSD